MEFIYHYIQIKLLYLLFMLNYKKFNILNKIYYSKNGTDFRMVEKLINVINKIIKI